MPVPSHSSNSGEPSISKHAIQQLASLHPAPGILLKYRQDKSVRAAAATLLAHTDPSSQLVYPELDPLGAATGRFSCSNPNFQGLPAPLLEAVEARFGYVLVEADISQCELRGLAHFSRDPRLLAAYQNNGVDVHRRTTAAVLGVPECQITPAQRERYGKRINFGIVFGEGPVGLSQDLGVTVAEAERLLAAYFAAHPGVQQWIDHMHDSVRNTGEVRTLSGRRRRVSEVWSDDPAVAGRALRQAVNTVIQGTAADLIKLALVRLNLALLPDVRMLMTVHDSVLLEVPAEMVAETRRLVVEAMQTLPAGFTVPISVDVKTGRSWAECKAGDAGCAAAA